MIVATTALQVLYQATQMYMTWDSLCPGLATDQPTDCWQPTNGQPSVPKWCPLVSRVLDPFMASAFSKSRGKTRAAWRWPFGPRIQVWSLVQRFVRPLAGQAQGGAPEHAWRNGAPAHRHGLPIPPHPLPTQPQWCRAHETENGIWLDGQSQTATGTPPVRETGS